MTLDHTPCMDTGQKEAIQHRSLATKLLYHTRRPSEEDETQKTSQNNRKTKRKKKERQGRGKEVAAKQRRRAKTGIPDQVARWKNEHDLKRGKGGRQYVVDRSVDRNNTRILAISSPTSLGHSRSAGGKTESRFQEDD
ncbi:hypothetical protein ACRALDRAFT_208943 [Sodiomyces alcalophilus JCM 7366]|uniref:uncharacterized protein n=1 Tax=Sodiomyces alcalophilus JCM 7366 TaxID=591952 RepID=UPI0039B628A2